MEISNAPRKRKQQYLGPSKDVYKHGSLGAQRGTSPLFAIILVAIAAIVVIAVAYLYYASGTPVIIYNRTITLHANQSSYFAINGVKMAIMLSKISSSKAYLSLGKSPIIANPIYGFSMYSGHTVNLSSSGSSIANIQVKLINLTNSSSTIEIIKIPEGFSVASGGFNTTYPVPLYLFNQTSSKASNQSTPETTTTIVQSSGSPSSSGTSNADAAVISVANSTYIGKLMLGLNQLYSQGKGCTETLYNTALSQYKGENPTGPLSFLNASAETPTGITQNVANINGAVYYINYTVSLPHRSPMLSLSMKLNSTTAVISSVSFSGAFQGLNYTTLNKEYTFQSSINNACAAYIT